MALVDALGTLFDFVLLPGQAHDLKGVAPLIEDVAFDALLADKAFDADGLLAELDARGASAVIPPKANRTIKRDYDKHGRNVFAKIKEFRAIATRYKKTACSYAANWHLAATIIASR